MKLFHVLTAASVLALLSTGASAGSSSPLLGGVNINVAGSLGIAKINGAGGNIGTWTNNNAGAGGVADLPPGTVNNNSTTSTTSFSAYLPIGGTTTPPSTGCSSTSSSSCKTTTGTTGAGAGGSTGTSSVPLGGTSLNAGGTYMIGEVNGGTATANNTIVFTPTSSGSSVVTPETGTTPAAPAKVGDMVSKTEVTSSSGIGTGQGATQVNEFGAVLGASVTTTPSN